MRFFKNIIITFFMTAFILLFAQSLPAYAAIKGYVAQDSDKTCFEYDYDDLLDSYALKMLGSSDGLYESFAAKKACALLNSEGRYLDYQAVLDQYAAKLLSGSTFDLALYLKSETAKPAILPSTIKEVKVVAGKVTHSDKEISTSTAAKPAEGQSGDKTTIKGLPFVTLEKAQDWAKERGAQESFVDIAPLYWSYGKKTGIRPEVLYAQAALTTSYGRFEGQVPASANNWAGIKKADDGSTASAQFETFATPDDGVRAHFNHMAAYLGFKPTGEPHARYHEVVKQSWAGSVVYVEDLSGKWDAAPDYHVRLLALLKQMDEAKKTPEENNNQAENPGDTPVSGSSTTEQTAGSAEQSVMVDVDILRLRSGPGTEYDILERLVRGTVLAVKETKGVWLKVTIPTGLEGWVHGDYVSEINTHNDKGTQLFKGKTIVIDAGHGGSDPGANGFSGLQEKVVNLAVAQHLAKKLEAAGAKVLLTRSADVFVSNQQRVDLANTSKADLFVSIHCNAFTKPESCGTEVHYCEKTNQAAASKYLAQQLLRELIPTLKLPDRGVRANSFFVLTKTAMPAALVELGFITNAEEEKLLAKKETQQAAAGAIFNGIEAYLQKYR